MSSSRPARRGVCLVVAAPSGAGKSTITRALLASDPGLELSVSATTRSPRPGEQDGKADEQAHTDRLRGAPLDLKRDHHHVAAGRFRC